MAPDTPHPKRRRGPAPWTPVLAAGGAALLAACLFDTRYAGTSSGVDNPSMIVAFQDENGAPVTLTGTASLYLADQNPALDPSPLTTLKVEGSDTLLLLGSDLRRTGALAKAAADAPVRFNLAVRDAGGRGIFLAGLAYDPVAKVFSRGSVDRVRKLETRARPLVSYAAFLARPDTSGGATSFAQVYVPGSPYRAALAESAFVFAELPQGLFPLRMLAEDGRVFAVRESLDTRQIQIFTTPRDPLDSVPPSDSTPRFEITAGPDREAFLGAVNFIEVQVRGLDPADVRIAVVWTQIRERGETANQALLVSQNSYKTEVKFPAEGIYRFEAAVAVGLRVIKDTLILSVRKPPVATPRVIKPAPGDSLVLGQTYRLYWEMPAPSDPVHVLFSHDGGASWQTLAQRYVGPNGLGTMPWTPGLDLGASRACLLRVFSATDSNVVAKSGFFSLLPPR